MRSRPWPARALPALAAAVLLANGSARANLSAVLVYEPTARKDGMMVSRPGMESNLTRALGQSVTVSVNEDLTDAMRSTRSGGADVFVAPPQVAASAMAHGYELVGSTAPDEPYVLVARSSFANPGDLRRASLFLPQQDSIYTYMARGMLNAHGLSFKDLRRVEYARQPQAGLVAVALGLYDATVVRRDEWEAWDKDNPRQAKVLVTSELVPGGFSVAVRKTLPAEARSKVSRLFTSEAQSFGMRPVALRTDTTPYRKVAELGTFTPTSLPGAKVVSAADVDKLKAEGAVLVDTRTEKEFKARHIPGALFIPYVEKSLKDVAYDASVDDFSGLSRLDPAKPTVFFCNGPECWKSYKASKAAVGKGFKTVYWFRGGMPEWGKANLQVATAP
ncbi:MAG TPA: PhnD/SsuA/transferrin family substrate-binding protein [Rubrivivax sp.]|jgi:rhodanese-related sulfurtransferase/ABC-type phosphate/phosphonate transport system substrate-binding protein|nr:PhnD/SsuA/transferrin family substrate-binding protein [Rubrivivax sp.]